MSITHRLILCVAFALTIATSSAHAQDSHEVVIGSLVAACLESAIEQPGLTVDTLSIARPHDVMALDPAVLGTLRKGGRTIFVSPWVSGGNAHTRLRYQLESGSISLVKISRKQIERRGSVAVSYTIVSPDGSVLSADRCQQIGTDVIDRRLAADWSARTWGLPITVDPLPKESLLKRVAKPAVAVVATSVGLYLLFTLRSERQNDSQ